MDGLFSLVLGKRLSFFLVSDVLGDALHQVVLVGPFEPFGCDSLVGVWGLVASSLLD